MSKRIVVKVGTSVLTAGKSRLYKPGMAEIVRQLAELHTAGCEIILCSSGAIQAGKDRLGWKAKPRTVAEKQMLAALGQSRLMFEWERLFEIYDIHVGQVLLTRSDFEARNRFLNARDTFRALIDHRIIPIVNENDVVTTEEIRVGDNDNLSAMVAVLADANLLIMLTDQKGLYTADPRSNPDAKLIQEVHAIDDEIRELAGGKGEMGTGGMATKLQAAETATRAGTDVVIAAGSEKNIITRILQNDGVPFTRFPAVKNPVRNRKRWLLAGSATSGAITVNAMGSRTLRQEKGRSLLPAGITAVEGSFVRGETVQIQQEDGTIIGRGLARYNSVDLGRIAGRQSDEIENILGYAYGKVAVHHNDMVLLESR
ncbi:MAG: glutamate 5-kinase [Cellvibrionaceae bacterium]|jgi:glutamate 5-kinase